MRRDFSSGIDFTEGLYLLAPNRKMVQSWLLSSGMRLSFVIALKSHLGLLGIIRSISVQERIKGITTTEEEAIRRIRLNNPELLICSDTLAERNGFSLCRRDIQAVGDLRVLMVMTSDDADVNLAINNGAMEVVCEEDFLSPEIEVMQSLLAAANQVRRRNSCKSTHAYACNHV
jgi:DNA-binding NarL/FixJ family response regulator